MIQKKLSISIIAKCIIVLFWITVFVIAVYLPSRISFLGDQSITIATWTDLIDPRLMEEFYKETGIRVTMSYFEDNYELVQKIRADGGQGYDLIIPSDFAVEQLIQYDLLKPLNKQMFMHWDRLNPQLTNIYCDKNNRYSIPYHWAIYGLGVAPDFFMTAPDNSWSLIFEQPHPPYSVAVLGAPRESTLIAAQYLFKTINNLTKQNLEKIQDLLVNQKQWVEAYTEFRADYLLLSKACPVVVITTPQILRLLKSKQNNMFILPKEGGFQVVDSWVIPRASAKSHLVYKFLNFLYQPKILKYHFNKYTFFPATLDLFDFLSESEAGQKMLLIHQQQQIPPDFFRNVLNEDLLNALWIFVKAS